jgi:membrane-associated phospholipid phosphatase
MRWFQELMTGVSCYGFFTQAALVVIVLSLVLYFKGLIWEAILAVSISVGVESLDFITKMVVQRPRPTSDLVYVAEQLRSFSFPSGHVMFYTGFLCYLSLTILKPSTMRACLIAIFASLIGLVGRSRVYLGAHWPIDVLGGYLASCACLLVVIQIYCQGQPRVFSCQE